MALAGIGVILAGTTGTLGGHLVGNQTEVGEMLRRPGWEIYLTYYLPELTLLTALAGSVIFIALRILGRCWVRP